ncbi:hypothetical protein MJD09_10190 [bacterium]|nr:hypothetical protein [bacterium]
MFAKRNSLTLATIWLILLLIGIFWYVKDARVLMEVMQAKKKYAALLQTSQAQIQRLTEVETVYEQMAEKWTSSPKRIIAAEEPTFTLSYLNWIVSSNDLDINYDFVLNDKNKSGDYSRFTYTLTGEGSYEALNEMIWYLTYRPVLYKINNITMNRADAVSDHLKFSMRLQGFTVEGDARNPDDLKPFEAIAGGAYQAQHDIFKPLVRARKAIAKNILDQRPKLPLKRPGQVDVEKAKLRAVTPSSVFVSEGKSGMVQLEVGDTVYLGKLVKINLASNQAEFLITKHGRSRKITLGIDTRD